MTALSYVAFNAVLLFAAASDIRSLRIPNPIPLALAVLALALQWPHDLAEAVSRLESFGVTAAIGLALYLARMLGGGDLKLLAAAALWMPLNSLAVFATGLGVAGGVQGVGALLWPRPTPGDGSVAARNWHEMPYALSIAAAGLWWTYHELTTR